jgi:hypothetical protein
LPGWPLIFSLLDVLAVPIKRENDPVVLYLPVQAYFVCNVDETGIMSCGWTLKNLGNAEHKKHKNPCYSRFFYNGESWQYWQVENGLVLP